MAKTQWNQSKSPAMKPIFAAYLNLARHNAYRCLLHVSKQMHIQETLGESDLMGFQLWKLLLNGSSTEKMKIIKLLQKRFPILRPFFDLEKKKEYIMVSSDPKEIKRFFSIVLDVLRLLRNEYSHYDPDKRIVGTEEKSLIPFLYNCLDGAARETKSRFALTVNDPKTEEQASRVLTIQSMVEELFPIDDEENEPLYAIEEMNKAVYAVFQGEFRKEQVTVMGKDGKPIKNKKGKKRKAFQDRIDYYYSLKKEDGSLSDMGIIFFICLFLEKRYGAMFLDAIKPWPKDFDEYRKKAVLEVFTANHIRLPKEKYDSTMEDYALGLDMLNELQKCPRKLFDTLPSRCRDLLSVDIQSDREDVLQDDGVTVKNGKVQMKRIKDRFAPLALQFIDKKRLFSDLRFMVHLGSYRFKFRMKQCLSDDAPDTLRILEKEINGFGRIDEIEKKRKEVYSPSFKPTVTKLNKDGVEVQELVPDTVDSVPYITDTKAHYLIDNNRVGIRAVKKSCFLPKIIRYETADGKKPLPVPCKSATEVKLLSPQAWLSIYELPGLVFYQYLYEKYRGKEFGFKSAEEVIKSYIEAYERLFKAVENGSFQGWNAEEYAPLALKDLPEKLQKYISSPRTTQPSKFAEKGLARIENMLAWNTSELKGFDRKVKMMESKENKLNSKHYVDLRPGAIAERLSRDIMLFMPEEEDKKWITSANFNSLQSALALSDTTTQKVKEMLGRFKQSEFLEKALKEYNEDIFSVFSFYKVYLEKRKEYLEALLKAKMNNEDLMGLAFLHSSRIRWRDRDGKYIQELAGRYLENEQFDLPRSLFTPHVMALLRRNNIVLPKPKEGQELGMTYIINHFYEQELKDDNQPFYKWPRHYDIYDILNGQSKGNQRVHHFLSPAELAVKMASRKDIRPNDYILKNVLNAICQDPANRDLKSLHQSNVRLLKDSRVVATANKMIKALYRDYDDNERTIRRYAVQDKIMFLMAKEMLLDIDGIDTSSLEKFKLNDILPGKENTILELQVPFKIILTIDGVTVTIRQEEKIKVKRYGEFFRYNSDTRLRSLLPYLVNLCGTSPEISVEIDRDALERELDAYDLNRTKVMKLVHSLEQSILARSKEEVSKEIRENFNALISKVGKIDYESQGKTLINIRNSYCHNYYAQDISIPAGTPLSKIADEITKLFDNERKRRPGVELTKLSDGE